MDSGNRVLQDPRNGSAYEGQPEVQYVPRRFVTEAGEYLEMTEEISADTPKSGGGNSKKDPRKSHKNFVALYPDALALVRWDRIYGNGARVLLGLSTCLGFNEPAVVWQNRLAAQFGMAKGAINETFNRLIAEQLIVREDVHHYWVDPRIMWFGSEENRVIERQRLIREGLIPKTLGKPKGVVFE